MAKLPGSEALGERPVPVLPRRTPMVAEYRPQTGFENAGAEQMQHSAAEFEQTSHIVLQAKEQADTLAAEDAYNKLRTKQMDLTYGPNGIMNQKGAATVNRDLPAEYGGQLTAAADELSGGLGNDFQKKLFARRAQTAQLQLQEHAFQHVARESDVYANQVLQGTLDTEQRVAAAGGDMPTSMLRINEAINRHAQRFGTPEQEVTSLKMKAADALWSSKIKSLIYTNPLQAQKLFSDPEINSKIGPANRIVLEHELHTVIRPIEAKDVAERAMNPQTVQMAGARMEAGGEPVLTPVVNQESGPGAGFPKESKSEALSRAQTSLGILKKEQTERPDDPALQREIARTEALVADLGKQATVAPTAATATPTTVRDLRAQLGTFVVRAEQLAEQMHPGDAVFRDQVIAQVKGKVSTIAAAFEGEQRQAHGTLLTHLSGGPNGKATKPTTLDGLLALPGARQAYSMLDPGSLNGINAALEHNQVEAMGRAVRSDPVAYREARSRIYQPDGDPRKLTSPAQLTQLYAQNVTHSDVEGLRQELDQQMSVSGRTFTADVESARVSAHRRFMSTPVGSIQPDKAEEAAYKFASDLNAKIAEYGRTPGKDARSLITPGSPDYMLAADRLATYMPSARQVVADKAGAAAVGQYETGKVYEFNQGKYTYKGGDPRLSTSWQAGAVVGSQPRTVTAASGPVFEQFIKERTIPRKGKETYVDAPAKSPAAALNNRSFASRQDALNALNELYGGAK